MKILRMGDLAPITEIKDLGSTHLDRHEAQPEDPATNSLALSAFIIS